MNIDLLHSRTSQQLANPPVHPMAPYLVSPRAIAPRWFRLAIFTVGLTTMLLGSTAIVWASLRQSAITDYQSCAAHYPVLTSYPSQCNTPDGRHFVQPTPKYAPTQPTTSALPQPSPTSVPTTTQVPSITPLATPTPTASAIFPLPTPDSAGIYGSATLGPTCPGPQRVGETCTKPYQGTFIVRLANTAAPYTTFTTDAEGHYSLTLPPGDFTISLQSTSSYPMLRPTTITVLPEEVRNVDLNLDTGIR